MFEGSYPLTLDAKGRMSVPAKLRESLVELGAGQVTVTRWLDNCLRIYPQPAWIKMRDEEIPSWPMTASGFGKALLQSADSQQLDSAGRILIRDSLRSYAGLARRVVLAGDGAVLELWDEMRHTRFLDDQMAMGLPAELKLMKRF